ncbi:MAG: tripartite tricarboxylate transporter TctB family protein [Eubacteriales bacterium]|nr:tripartite tricarboxylate transporter TctB family protein [Eubacteriales bacterium]
MKIKESKAEIFIGLFLFIFALLLLFYIIPTQIRFVPSATTSPRLMPRFVAIIIGVLSLTMMFFGYLKRNRLNQKEFSISQKEAKLVILTLIVIAIYTMAVKYIRYIPTTIISLAFLMWAFGQKSKIKLVLISTAVPIVIYVFFTNFLKIRLP